MRVMMAMSSFSGSSTCSEGGHVELRRGPWTLDEDTLLIHYIASNGEGRWNLLAKRSGLRRTGKSCRLRWLNYLKPDVKHGNLSPQEQLLIIELHSKWGNRWSKIAQHLPGRTDNEIKNYWRTRVQKQAKHLRIDSNSTAFQDILRCIWIPRLLQKIEKTSSSSALSSSSSPSAISSQDSIILQSFYQDSDYQFPPPPQQQQLPDLGTSNMTMSSASQIPQLSEHPTSPFHALVTSLKDCYYLDNNCYDMENFNLATMSAAVQPDDIHYPISDCHVDESNWVDNDLAECLWNLT